MTGAPAIVEREPAAPEPVEKPVSLRDSLVSAFKSSKDPAEKSELSAEPSVEAISPAKSQDKPPASRADGERARGPDGKFVPTDEAKPALDAAAKAEKAPKEKPEASLDLNTLPEAERATVQKFPPEAQAWISKREKLLNQHYAGVGREVQNWRKTYGPVEDVLGPRRASIHASGQNEAGLLQQMFAIGDIMSQAPDQFIKQFAQAKGVDLARLVQSNRPAQIDPALQPVVGKLQELDQRQSAWEHQQEQARVNSLLSDINGWAYQRDAGGNLLRPHYATFDANGEMAPIVADIRAKHPQAPNWQVLQAAYDRCLWANPETRKEMQERTASEERAKAIEAEKAAAAAALKRSGSVTGSQMPGAVPVKPTGLREQLTQGFRQQLARI